MLPQRWIKALRSHAFFVCRIQCAPLHVGGQSCNHGQRSPVIDNGPTAGRAHGSGAGVRQHMGSQAGNIICLVLPGSAYSRFAVSLLWSVHQHGHSHTPLFYLLSRVLINIYLHLHQNISYKFLFP